MTALMLAAWRGNVSACELLLLSDVLMCLRDELTNTSADEHRLNKIKQAFTQITDTGKVYFILIFVYNRSLSSLSRLQ